MTTRSTPLAIAALARAVAMEDRDVVDVAPERPGVATTYGPRRAVKGALVEVAGAQGRVLLHVAMRYGVTLDRVGSNLRAKVAQALDEAAPEAAPWRVDVRIVDLVGDRIHPDSEVRGA